MNPFALSFLVIAIGWVLICILDIIQGTPTRRICLKSAVNWSVRMSLFTGLWFFYLTGTVLFLPFTEYMDSLIIYWGATDMVWLMQSMPVAAAIMLTGFSCWGVYKSFEYRAWKFTDEEEKLLTQEHNKNIAAHTRLAKFFRLKTKSVEGGLSIRPF